MRLFLYFMARKVVPTEKLQAAVRAYEHFNNLLKYGDYNFFREVTIEISKHCNRRCYYCPQSIDPLKKELITDETLGKILFRLQEIDWSGPIGVAHFNEPLLHPYLTTIVRKIKRALPKSMFRLYSNGDLLTEQRAQELIEAGVVNFSVTRHDLDDKDWNNRVVPIAQKFPSYFTLNVLHGKQLSSRIGMVSGFNVEQKSMCDYPEAALHISVRGDVLLCGSDYYGKLIMGNVATQTLKQIWASYKQERALLKKGIASRDSCKKCLNAI